MGAEQLRPSRSLMVCLTCQHFQHTLAEAGVTQPVCARHQQLLPQGAHLDHRCHQWMQRLEKEIGWCPEGA
ncbi:galactose oxidase [Synechococcus sp. MU1611]|uniref:galactose oxidase n=2 Tax=Synechococcus TaxID=1129 RepID=UPI001CF8822D|nr:galactose oxidase [Synechococcus sp. MU1611]